MRQRLGRLGLTFAALLFVVGCAARSASIGQLQMDPGRYQDKQVTVHGVVTSSWGLPLVPFKMYKVSDGTGEMTVLSRSNRTPNKGARVKVRGRLNQVAQFGGRSIGLHIEERDLKFEGQGY